MFNYIYSQKKVVHALRINEPIKIDGVLDEAAYRDAEPAKEFYQLQPYNGKAAFQPSEVYFLYDEFAIYVGAKLFDNNPDSIFNFLTERDDIGMSDYFGVYIDPFNTGQLAYGFFVTPAGIQTDIKATHNDDDIEDGNWNEVWQSKTRIDKNGWSAEICIPYTALRFPEGTELAWGLNMFRNIRRYNSNNSWNLINQSSMGFLNQQGELKGIKNIKSPLRLSFTPYLATYYENSAQQNNGHFLYKGGLDVKYGINESFTLDMMLIPDFGQIQSDDKQLNLSPFELYYDEKRQFFTEGTELFNRGDIFYSRRIGSAPKFTNNINASENEILNYNPSETQLINATKISGRTNNGWGLGVLNAMSLASYATMEDTVLNSKRKIMVQPFTNYNVAVIDKSLPNNSYFSIINTNVSMIDNPFTANVTATDFQFRDKSKTYMLKGKGAISIRGEETKETGFYSVLGIEKNKGLVFGGINQHIYSDKYNPNDLGYLHHNNQSTSEIWLFSQSLHPFWIFRRVNGNIQYNYNRMFSPNAFYDHELNCELYFSFKNNYSFAISSQYISNKYDYYEPRVDNRFFYSPQTFIYNLNFFSDQRKNFSFGAEFQKDIQPVFNMNSTVIGTGLMWRIGQRCNINFENEYKIVKNEYGFVGFSNQEDSIIFSKRNVNTSIGTLSSSFIINNSTSLSLRARHYWSAVQNQQYFNLNNSGQLDNTNSNNYNFDQNYNALTVDLILRWIFAPGSELSLALKTYAYSSDDNIEMNYISNVKNVWINRSNSISLKILYYLDYNTFSKKLKRKSTDNESFSFNINKNTKRNSLL